MSKTNRYILGFLLCIGLTLLAFFAVWLHSWSGHAFPSHYLLALIIAGLAVVQLFVQLVFFLHIGKESTTRDILALIFALVIVFFVVGGTLWIMTHLSHHGTVPFDGEASPKHQHGGF